MFSLGTQSRSRLTDVHPALVRVVERAITLTAQDFTVLEGLRSYAQQVENVRKHVSKTLASKHLRQPDGFGHAVDLVPIHGGQPRWEWPLIYPMAAAVKVAADQLGVSLRWGGVWDMHLDTLPATTEGLKSAVAAYCLRHGGPDFLDGPHFELL